MAPNTPKPAKKVKELHDFEGVKIVEWENARKGQKFQVMDPQGYHYRYSYTLEDAKAIVFRIQKWGW